MSAPIAQALLSVSDKTGIVDSRAACGDRRHAAVDGGTAKALAAAGCRSPRSATTPAFPKCSTAR
jgi:AICAR transformylase/IMP cyclohydrolase PurH